MSFSKRYTILFCFPYVWYVEFGETFAALYKIHHVFYDLIHLHNLSAIARAESLACHNLVTSHTTCSSICGFDGI